MELWEPDDLTVLELAERFGVCEGTLRRSYREQSEAEGRIPVSKRRRGSPRRFKLAGAERGLLVELWEAEELTVREIAKSFDVSMPTVVRSYRREKEARGQAVVPRGRKESGRKKLGRSERGRLVELWGTGELSLSELADRFGVSTQTVRRNYREEQKTQGQPHVAKKRKVAAPR